MYWLQIKPDELNLESRNIDAAFWGSVVARYPQIRKVMPRRSDKVIGGDLFNLLFQWTPQVRTDAPDPALAEWLKQAAVGDRVMDMRRGTMGDQDKSAAASVQLFRELMRPQKSTMKAIAETKHNKDQIKALVRDKPGGKEAIDAIEQSQQKLAEGMRTNDTNVNEPGRSDLGNLMSHELINAVSSAEDIIDTAEELSEYGGGYSVGNGGNRLLDLMMDEEFISSITRQHNLAKIVKIAGRMKLIFNQAKSTLPVKSTVPVGVTVGDDLPRVLPYEIAFLANEVLAPLFWRKFADKDLMQYSLKNRDNIGQGPFVCCVDVSGSMMGAPLEHALGLFVALAELAVKENRQVVLMPFADRAHSGVYVKNAKGLADLLLKVSSRRHGWNVGGGTAFEPPLTQSADIIEQEPDLVNADVLFISDGVAGVNPSWCDNYMKRKAQAGFRLVGVSVHQQWREQYSQMFDATAMMGSGAEISELEWAKDLAPRLV